MFYSSNFFFCVTSLLPLLIRDLSSTNKMTFLLFNIILFIIFIVIIQLQNIKAILIHFYLITMSKNYKQNRALPLCLFRDEPFKSSTIEG